MARRAVALLLAVAITAVLLQPPTAAALQEKPPRTAKLDNILDILCQVSVLCAQESECPKQVQPKADIVCERCDQKDQELVEKYKDGNYANSTCQKVMEYRSHDVHELMQHLCDDHFKACAREEPPSVPKDDKNGFVEFYLKPFKVAKMIVPKIVEEVPKFVNKVQKFINKGSQKMPDEEPNGFDILWSLCENFTKYGETKDETKSGETEDETKSDKTKDEL